MLLLSATSLALMAQEKLVVKNKKTGRALIYEQYARVTYICVNEQEYRTGILNALLDSAVVLGTDTIALKEIAGLRRKNPAHIIARAAGLPLMLTGSIFMGQGAARLLSEPKPETGMKNILLGAMLFAVGYIPYELSLKELSVGFDRKWELQVLR